MQLNLQGLSERKVEYNLKKLRHYLNRPLEDPLEEVDQLACKSEKKRKIKQIAQAVQHYHSLVAKDPVEKKTRRPEADAPELRYLIPFVDGYDCWREWKKYRMCVYGNKNVLQQGDLLYLEQGEKAIITDFTFTKTQEGNQISINTCLCKLKSDLPPDWQLFMSSSAPDSVIRTDECKTFWLGDIRQVVYKADLKLCHFQLIRGALKLIDPQQEMKVMSDRRSKAETSLMTSYITCSRKMLHHHPLVIAAAKFVNIRMSPEQMRLVILRDFYPFNVALVNDEEDAQQYDIAEFRVLHPMNNREDECSVCREHRRIAFDDTGHDSICEMCYVSMRKICEFMPELERLRRIAHQTRTMPVIEAELENIISDFLNNNKTRNDDS